MSSSRTRLTGALALGVAAAGLVAPAASANPAGTGLVINEVYGGGGNANAVYTNDFIELYNPSTAPISLNGKSLQYRSAAPSSAVPGESNVFALPDVSVPAGGYFLVKAAPGTTVTDKPLPAFDAQATGTALNLSGTGGQIYLADTITALDAGTGPISSSAVIDFVGWGSSTTSYEGTVAAPTTNATSLARKSTGADSDDNAADFAAGAPTPTASGGATIPDPEPTPDPVLKTIPEIQGTGPASPLLGTKVIARGIVTAAYPTGGLNGFYIQTPGSGSASLDLASRTSSDGVFVYQESAARPVTVVPGDYVQVTGTVAEYAGITQVSVAATSDIAELTDTVAPVVATSTTAWPETAAEKEKLEGVLYRPSGDFTVTNTYSTNQYGEVGLARGNKPLIQPTQVADAQDAAAIAAVTADNLARSIVLDDAASTNYTATSTSSTVCGTRPTPCLTNGALTPPYISNTEPVRVGAKAVFDADVIFTEGGSASAPTYRFQPLAPVTGPDNAGSPVAFENTRTAAPDAKRINARGTADIKVASFNVLNYFTSLGDADDDGVADGTCTAYTDRAGDGVTVNTGCDFRGAWDPRDLERQQTKIVKAINALDADVVGLMEIENSLALGETADEATSTLVAALNADAKADVWAANPSSADLPRASEMDVIANAIIYRKASVKRLGASQALGALSGTGEAFDNAREPIAQAFQPRQGGTAILFAVNHFKSKGSGADDGTGQGNANPDRIAQATALRDWIPTVQAETGVKAVLLAGDFNSYAMEDPMQVLGAAGYHNVEREFGADEYSYSFSGLSGSLDHIVANKAAMDLATGADIWNINSGESLALEYSRWNYHGTDFHEPTPFRSSDHDPVILGLDLAPRVVDKVRSTTTVKLSPSRIRQHRTRALLRVWVRSAGRIPPGKVKVWVSGRGSRIVSLHHGHATLRLAAFTRSGPKTVKVTYLGTPRIKRSAASRSFLVLRR